MINFYFEDDVIKAVGGDVSQPKELALEKLKQLIDQHSAKELWFCLQGEPLNPSFHRPILLLTPYIRSQFPELQLSLLCGLEPIEINLEYYLEMCRINNANPLDISFQNLWEHSTARNLRIVDYSEEYQPRIREKVFFCQNNGFRPNRIQLIAELMQRNLFDQGWISMLFQGQDPNNILLSFLNSSKPNTYFPSTHKKVKQVLRDNIDKFPLVLDWQPSNTCPNLYIEKDRHYYIESYFSVVNETQFYRNSEIAGEFYDSYFFSEKIWKPIAMKQPFILAAVPNSLKILKEKGYQNFAPYIDETYDTIQCSELRVIAIAKEIERLSQQTSEQWLEWQRAVKPIVEHNHSILKNQIELKKNYNFN